MMCSAWHRLLPVSLIAGAATALASPSDPSDPATPVPALRHDSTTARHRPLAEPQVAPWQSSNDTVGRIGGWRAYAREAHDRASAPPSASSSPAPSAHHEHHH